MLPKVLYWVALFMAFCLNLVFHMSLPKAKNVLVSKLPTQTPDIRDTPFAPLLDFPQTLFPTPHLLTVVTTNM